MSGISTMRVLILGLAAALLAPVAANAQFSDSFTFLKAVRDRDGSKVEDILRKNSNYLDTKDITSGEAALHIVVRRRDSQWLSYLLAKGANPNTRDVDGNTPLIYAAQIGFADGVEQLLGRKAGVDVPNRSGETPLIKAVQAGDLQVVRLLVAAGANPKKPDSVAGKSAHDYAAGNPRLGVIQKVLDEAKPAAPARPIAGPKL
ncbi:ankyrin repeat domain-containing protein [Sphingomonas flavalba]|uniref:ankyrin repeat domain-containing protein n=1 Tax=Sphingomonas flavalba TaxID=2559804 RepID=UPI0039E17A02